MFRKTLLIALALTTLAATGAFAAASTFQNTCSNIEFVYSGNDAALQATCLRSNGTPNASTLILKGISNQNGKLVMGSGASTFQQSCGNILITVSSSGSSVTLSALCRTTGGGSNATSIALDGIGNNNGNLTY